MAKGEIKKVEKIYLLLIFLTMVLSSAEIVYSTTQSENCISYKTYKESTVMSPVGLEVDSNENIYLATNHQINVYSNKGEFLYVIRIPDSYIRMNMLDNDNISIAFTRGNILYTISPEGCLIDKEEYDRQNNNIYNIYDRNQKKEVMVSGNKYRLNNFFGYTKVTKIEPNGVREVVYRIPLRKWLLKVLLVILFICWFPFITLIVIKLKFKNTRQR